MCGAFQLDPVLPYCGVIITTKIGAVEFLRTDWCMIRNESILCFLWNDLAQIFSKTQLEAVRHGIKVSTLMYILRYWNWYNDDFERDSIQANLIDTITYSFQDELIAYPAHLRTTLAYSVAKYAAVGMNYCWMRVDETGINSVCSGDRIIWVQFLFITTLDRESVHIWFHHPDDGNPCFMELPAGEVDQLQCRLLFPNLRRPWETKSGSTRPLMYGGIYSHDMRSLGSVKPSPINIPSAFSSISGAPFSPTTGQDEQSLTPNLAHIPSALSSACGASFNRKQE
jgi:hypothetical protein